MNSRFLIIGLIITLGIQGIYAGEGACPNVGRFLNSNLVSPGNGRYSYYTWGIDLFSQSTLTSKTITCLQSTGKYDAIGIFLGSKTTVPLAINPTQYTNDVIQAFLNLNVKKNIILNLDFNLPNITQNILEALQPVLLYPKKINQLWIRTNMDANCPDPSTYIDCQGPPPNVTLALLLQAANITKTLGFQTGIYSNRKIWARWFNDTQSAITSELAMKALADYPFMYDDYDFDQVIPDFSKYKQIGNWTIPSAKMSGYWYIDGTCCWPGQISWYSK